MQRIVVLAIVFLAGAGLLGVPDVVTSAAAAVQLERIASGLSAPVYVTHSGDRSGRLFVVEQAGVIRIIRNGRLEPAPFLDIRDRVTAGGEMGLLSVAFHPRFASTGRFFVNYTTEPGGLRTVISEFRVLPESPDAADRRERTLLEIPQPFRNHNGGLNLFGPDGMLYVGMGDGGSARDPFNNGQRLDALLGKLLRIDVDADAPYGIPADNPFVRRSGARGEIWAYGLRNPWRFSFDRATGRLLLADVGQNAWEEVDLIERGGNYGWRIMEGAHCHIPARGCPSAGLTPPIAEYQTSLGCSVTGGYVYRGKAVPDLAGRYVFGDYCSGQIWTLSEQTGRWVMAPLLGSGARISSFGEDEQGEIYVVDHQGTVYRVVGR